MNIQRSFIIKCTHVFIFLMAIFFFFMAERESMLATMSRFTGEDVLLLNPSIMALFASMAVLSFFGRWSGKRLFLSLFTLTVYTAAISLFHGSKTDTSHLAYLASCCFILCPFLVCQFMYNAVLKVPERVIFLTFTVLMVAMFFYYLLGIKQALYFMMFRDFRGHGAYFFLTMMPFILLFPHKKTRLSLMVIILIAVLTSLKRGAILAFFASLIAYNILRNMASSKKFPLKSTIISLVIMSLIAVGYMVYDRMTEGIMTERFEAMQSDGGSGRDQVYQVTFNMILDSDVKGLLIGHGWSAVMVDSPLLLSAHNDFLEYAYDYGLIGLLLQILLLVHAAIYYLQLHRKKSHMAPAFAASLVILVICSMFSHIFFYTFLLCPLTLFWGYCIGVERKEALSLEGLPITTNPET